MNTRSVGKARSRPGTLEASRKAAKEKAPDGRLFETLYKPVG